MASRRQSSASPAAGAQVKRVAETSPSSALQTLIWAMGKRSSPSAPRMCAPAASCCSPLAMSASTAAAPISSAATPTSRARPISVLDVTTLPLYYGLNRGCLEALVSRLGVDYSWIQSRFETRRDTNASRHPRLRP